MPFEHDPHNSLLRPVSFIEPLLIPSFYRTKSVASLVALIISLPPRYVTR
jgi:hypothetical protein